MIPEHDTVPHLFTLIKQHGALLAKGRVAGIQFETLFTDDLYARIGLTAIEAADRIRRALRESGYELAFPTPTNQIFVSLTKQQLEALSSRVEMSFWEHLENDRTVMRIATSWATTEEDTDSLIAILRVGHLNQFQLSHF